ncbi:glycosyltransferase 87 family protein [Actinoplanes sichuanensis]|uniref:Glycosyltransferase 87 family protein n=1 Tax=Actinoplanes sichuanensis TaxID=512349 RepID=A0ABW4A300_9ACTN|nr:glycosyltransferase 87 family protein [Actinoplanes sichuanensis]BEL10671.1 glycosyltransferase 87 family protein [Actinoplanes sichuanensis]
MTKKLDLALYALSAVFALVTALTSTLLPHRAWGAVAAWGYLAAALLVYLVQRRDLLAWATWGAVALLPVVIQSVQRAGGRTDRAQEEVLVVEQMGESLLHSGTPYLSRTEIAAIPLDERLLGYRPYQPGMSIFGLPRAVAGDHWFTDARIWFAIATVVTLSVAVTLVRTLQDPSSVRPSRPLSKLLRSTVPVSQAESPTSTSPALVRAIQAATVLPVTALTLATGGDDIPVLALCLLALALAATGRPGWSGVAVGAAAACKLFALPVVAVLVVYATVTGTWRRLLPGALGLPLLALLPPLLVNADALIENVLRFPLGHGLVTSPAQSPFPGYLISQNLPGGRYIAAGLLVFAAAVIGLLLLRRPPRTARAAALFCGYGLLTAILLMPTTRFGYLLYPAALLLFAPALSKDTGSSAPRHDTALYRH